MNFELDTYLDALKSFPKQDLILKTEKGDAVFVKMDIFKKHLWYTYKEERFKWYRLTLDQVHEIIELNKKNEKSISLEEYESEIEIPETVNFEDAVGQDSLTRFDAPKKSKRRNNRNNNRRKKPVAVDGTTPVKNNNQKPQQKRKPRPRPNSNQKLNPNQKPKVVTKPKPKPKPRPKSKPTAKPNGPNTNTPKGSQPKGNQPKAEGARVNKPRKKNNNRNRKNNKPKDGTNSEEK